MKRLIICCDGTWNTPDQEENGIPAPTNVFKLYNALADETSEGVKQIKYYHPGVGADGGMVDSVIGGAFGAGISRHICNAYHWLGNNYEDGDEIYLFGFSRGAFTARSLGGFLSRGLLNLKGVDSEKAWTRVHRAYDEGYRSEGVQIKTLGPDWDFHKDGDCMDIQFVGVWDTVGALGVPDDLEILNVFDNKKKWQFHDTELGGNVVKARHAMAIDEIRSCFTVTRWNNAWRHADAKEVWFPGVHADVGGGYVDCDLSNGALLWMMDESGLGYRPGTRESIVANSLGVMHNSYKGAFAKLRSRPRSIDAMEKSEDGLFHDSALQRQKASPISYPAYHPTKKLAKNDHVTVEIFAGQHWNNTGLYLEKDNEYIFSCTGEWKDSKDVCDWRGTEDGKLTEGDIIRGVSAFLGHFEGLFKKITHNETTDFLGTKRVESFNWFVMIGAIANDSGLRNAVQNDGSPVAHQYVDLTKYTKKSALKVTSSGYLYCFPNDVWSLYGNNRGSVHLTITHVG